MFMYKTQMQPIETYRNKKITTDKKSQKKNNYNRYIRLCFGKYVCTDRK